MPANKLTPVMEPMVKRQPKKKQKAPSAGHHETCRVKVADDELGKYMQAHTADFVSQDWRAFIQG